MIEDLKASKTIQDWGMELSAASNIDELVSGCNLIVTTTSARQALIRADKVTRGTHITAMGSDDHGKQELEAELLGRADLVVADSVAQCVDHGECFHAVKGGMIREESIHELGNVIKNPKLGRTNDDQITVADLTGVAIQDIQIANMVCRALDSRGA
jgi:ornithine cyclodeaminase